MNILICISHVPDTNTKIQFDAEQKALNKSGVTFVINPYDEFALSRALEIQGKDKSTKITVLCVGGEEVVPTIRKALAVAGEEGVRINSATNDSQYIAHQIADYVKNNPFDIVMMGKESIDFNESVVPGTVAALLDVPFVSFATHLEVQSNKAVLNREIDGGIETVEVAYPFVLSAQKGLAEWKIPNIRGIMAAKKKPLKVVEPVTVEEKSISTHFETQTAKSGCKYIDAGQTQEIVQVLIEKGVI